jgi:prophage regulatory protein
MRDRLENSPFYGLLIMLNSNTIIRLPRTILKTGLSRSTIYSLVSRGDFPRQIKLSPRTMGFLESEIDAWIAGRIAASKAGVA